MDEEEGKLVRVYKPPRLHPRQHDFVYDQHRFVIGAMGTKFGKTWGLCAGMAGRIISSPQHIFRWIAPFEKQAMMAWRILVKFLPKGHYKPNKKDKFIEFLHPEGSSFCYFLTADNPDSLLGEGVHYCVVDEASRMKREAWDNILTTLTYTSGGAHIVSTPHGRNWFYEEYLKGVTDPETGKKEEKDYSSYNCPTSDNPKIPKENIDLAERTMPPDQFEEFYLAKFLEESAGCFTGLSRCIDDGTLCQPLMGIPYVMGVDLGKVRDWTVCIVIRHDTKEVVAFDRFRGLTWDEQISRIKKIGEQYGCIIYIDSHGMGDMPFEQLSHVYRGSVVPAPIANDVVKKQYIQNLRMDISNGKIFFPGKTVIPWLQSELEIYEIDILQSGRFRYAAPRGYHDDCVISLALAAWGCRYPAFKRTIGYDPGIGQGQPLRFLDRIRRSRR